MQAWHGLKKSSKVWRQDIFPNNKWIHLNDIRKKWSYYFMLMNATFLVRPNTNSKDKIYGVYASLKEDFKI